MGTQSTSADTRCPRSWHMPPQGNGDPLAQTPHEHLDQLRQWCAQVQPPPRSRLHWNGPVLPRTPDGNDYCPSNEGTPRCALPPPQIRPRNIHANVPKWRLSSEFAGTCHWEWLTKSKTTIKIGMRACTVPKEATNQNLIPRQRHVHVHLTGNQSKLGPQLMHQFITPPQTQNLDQRRDLGQYGETRINCPTTVSNEIFCKRIFSLTTCGPLKMRSRWRATSSSFLTLPSKSSTRQPGVSKRRRWSRGNVSFPDNGAGSRACRGLTPTHLSCIVGNKSD